MKTVKAFLLTGCPYCRNGLKAYEQLCTEHPEYKDIPVEWISEDEYPDVADRYDYYHVPSLFVDEEKLYECEPGQDYDQIYENFDRVLNAAMTQA